MKKEKIKKEKDPSKEFKSYRGVHSKKTVSIENPNEEQRKESIKKIVSKLEKAEHVLVYAIEPNNPLEPHRKAALFFLGDVDLLIVHLIKSIKAQPHLKSSFMSALIEDALSIGEKMLENKDDND